MMGSSADPGIIPRVAASLFDGVGNSDENIDFTIAVSYVEIYMEKIRCLLDPAQLKNNLAVREEKGGKGIYIEGVTQEYVTSQEELLEIMDMGAVNRTSSSTGMNDQSSRSHSVFTITVAQRDTSNGSSKSGKLVLVDLAGSEMVRKSKVQGQQLEEAKVC
jgi:kinesin family protein 5